MKYQSILGSGGSIGRDLAKELVNYTGNIRLVARNPKKVNDGDVLFSADLTDPGQVDKAIEGSEITYITVGFEYKASVWEKVWPPFMKSVIESCIKHQSKLVFFDNVYLYAPEEIPYMTENSRIDPTSRKGKVRKRIFDMINAARERGDLTALIARAPDFYGPKINNSFLIEMVFKNLEKGKAANWLCDPDKKHSFIYTPDAAKATALLGNTPDAYGQVWHLPVDPQSMTGREWMEAVAKEMNVKPKMQVISKTMSGVLGLFIPVLRESKEMLYQLDRDYFFDSSKFTSQFDFKVTSYEEGIRKVIEAGY